MKHYFGLFLGILLASTTVRAWDPFSVYNANAPEGCLDASIGTDALTLSDLIEIGICNNPSLNRGFLEVKGYEAEWGSVKSAYLPSLNAKASVEASETKTQHQNHQNNRPYGGSVALDWLLFDFGGRSATTAQTKAYLDAAGFSYNGLLQDTVLDITKSYYTLLSDQAVLDSAQESEKSYKKSYEDAKKRFDVGLVPLNDMLLAKTSYEQSKLSVIKAQNSVHEASGNLATLLNLAPDTTFHLKKPDRNKDSIKLHTDKTVQELIDIAVAGHSAIKQKQSEKEATKYGLTLAKSDDLPSLSLGASVSGDDSFKSGTPYQYGASAGVTLSVPLFTGFKNSYNIDKARFAYEQAEYALTATVDEVQNAVWSAWQNYQSAVSAYEISKDVLKSAKENERVASASYAVGKESILNLLTANSQLATARQENATAFYTVLITKATLYRIVGRF